MDYDIDIGKKIKQLRKNKEMTIRNLASETGITASMISQIENNQVNPSINSLKVIAKALNIPLYLFFKENEDAKTMIVHPNERTTLGQKNQDTIYELLTPDTRGNIEFGCMRIPCCKNTAEFKQSHTGEEVDLVMKGEVLLELEDESILMKQGDSIRIPAGAKHRWVNQAEKEAEVVYAIDMSRQGGF